MYRVAIALLIAASVAAQTPALPPVRQLDAPIARSAKSFARVSSVRALPGGKLLVNDPVKRQLVLTDSTLTPISVIADTTTGNDTQYGARPAGLLRYLGDSSLFVETSTPAMYLIDPTGKVVRTMSVPAPRDAASMAQSTQGMWAATDSRGRIVYRGFIPRAPEPKSPPGELRPFSVADTSPIFRVDPATRKSETIAWYKGLRIRGVRFYRADGSSMSYTGGEPLPLMDDFAMLADGSLAILRADYHLDIIAEDGTTTSSAKIPYPWERLTDDGKVALLDSLKKAREAASTTPPSSASGGNSTGGSALGGASGSGGPPRQLGDPDPNLARSLVAPKVDDLPDYRPAFGFGAMFADANGNAWIRTLQPARTKDVAIYDVVSREGKLLDRIELRKDRAIVGFDRSAVYLLARDEGGAWLERVRIK